ncbi:Histidine-rich membrane protein KE4-like protein 1 [Diplonema papillatum]|nr:Histidine-rich membrane protein KE4-like protein 1 [Diplonema papillatum]
MFFGRITRMLAAVCVSVHAADYSLESRGRLAVVSLYGSATEVVVYDVDDRAAVGAFELPAMPDQLVTTSAARYAAYTMRENGSVGFIDGGIWREDHVAHLHDYKQPPAAVAYSVVGSRPTHVVTTAEGDETAVFFDGADGEANASVVVFTDSDITAEKAALPSVQLARNVHGIAEPHHGGLLVSVRRADDESTSANKVLPDQIAVFERSSAGGAEYTLTSTVATLCPDLHGAATSDTHAVFCCSDGVVVLARDAGTGAYTSAKVANPKATSDSGRRLGSIAYVAGVDRFVGAAAAGEHAQWVAVDPVGLRTEVAAETFSKASNSAPGFGGSRLAVCHDDGNLTVISGAPSAAAAQGVAWTGRTVPVGSPSGGGGGHTLAASRHAAEVFVLDKQGRRILAVSLESLESKTLLNLSSVPSAFAWTGIPEQPTQSASSSPAATAGPSEKAPVAPGRLAVSRFNSTQLSVVDTDDHSILADLTLSHAPDQLVASGSAGFALASRRAEGYVAFVDSGLRRGGESTPAVMPSVLSGASPTHLVVGDARVAVFFDGAAPPAAAANASVTVLTDDAILHELSPAPSLSFPVNMHGVAESAEGGRYLVTSYRRPDTETTSTNPVLPDQVAVYKLQSGVGGGYSLEEIFPVECPDLHGAAAGGGFFVFGCSDGVVVVDGSNGAGYTAVHVGYPAELAAAGRIGSVVYHNASQHFIGVANGHGGAHTHWIAVDPAALTMAVLAETTVAAAGYAAGHLGEHFVVCHADGSLAIHTATRQGGMFGWHVRTVAVTTAAAELPEGTSFSLAVSRASAHAFVADPITESVVVVDLRDAVVVARINLPFVPSKLAWLGFPEEDLPEPPPSPQNREGRLVVSHANSTLFSVVSCNNTEVVTAGSFPYAPDQVATSPGSRYAVIAIRDRNWLGFVDSGLSEEAAAAAAPGLLAYQLAGPRPTHLVVHEGRAAVFFDGNGTHANASVVVLTDEAIAAALHPPPAVNYTASHHGVAEPVGEAVVASFRRPDAETASENPALPDKIAVFRPRAAGGGFELDGLLAATCPDLHGAAATGAHVAFACSDGFVVATLAGGVYSAEHYPYTGTLADLGRRVGTFVPHEASGLLIGQANEHGGAHAYWIAVDPVTGSMEEIAETHSAAVSYAVGNHGAAFAICHADGTLTVLVAAAHGDHYHWEKTSVVFSGEDGSAMPAGFGFAMTVSKSDAFAYISDPLANRIVVVDLSTGEVVDRMDPGFAPYRLAWTGLQHHVHEPETPSEEPAAVAGRLVISHGDESKVSVVAAGDGSVLLAGARVAGSDSADQVVGSGGARFALVSNRDDNLVGFVDGGLYEEPHGDHVHAEDETPSVLSITLNGPRPTHIVVHDGKSVVFFDGNPDTQANASVVVLTDESIEAFANGQLRDLPVLNYTQGMHGVAEPKGDLLLATHRRPDGETTSSNPILPDAVGVYRLGEGNAYELVQVLEDTCADLHGAAASDEYAVFGCTDGVVVAWAGESGVYESSRIAYTGSIAELGWRIGTFLSHGETAQFVGIANGGESRTLWIAVDPAHLTMELVAETASAASHAVGFNGKHVAAVHGDGSVTVIAAEAHGDHYHWHSETLPLLAATGAGASSPAVAYALATSRASYHAFVADPSTRSVVTIDLQTQAIVARHAVPFVPGRIAWLGIPEDTDHPHDDATHAPAAETPLPLSPAPADGPRARLSRLAVGGPAGVSVFGAEDRTPLGGLALEASEELFTSGGGRFVVSVREGADGRATVTFVDGGVFLDEAGNTALQTPPAVVDGYSFEGRAPASAVAADGLLSILFAAGPAGGSVRVLSDAAIAGRTPDADLPSFFAFPGPLAGGFAVAQGSRVLVFTGPAGVAGAAGVSSSNLSLHVLAESAASPGLSLAETVPLPCDNLAGVASAGGVVVVGCGGAVVVVRQAAGGGSFLALKIALPAAGGGVAVQTVTHHGASGLFIAHSADAAGNANAWAAVDASASTASALPAAAGSAVLGSAVGYAGKHYLVLDRSGTLRSLVADAHDDHFDWSARSLSLGGAGGYKMAVSQDSYEAYVASAAGQAVYTVDLETMLVTSTLSLDFAPSSVAWVGIPGDGTYTLAGDDECSGVTRSERWGYTLLFTVAISLIAGGVILVVVPVLKTHRYVLELLLSFAVGALIGDVFFHIMPILMGAHGGGETHGDHVHESETPSQWRVNMLMTVILLTLLLFYWVDWAARSYLHGKHLHLEVEPDHEPVNENENVEDDAAAQDGDDEEQKKKKKQQLAEKKEWYAWTPMRDLPRIAWVVLLADGVHNITDGLSIGASFSKTVRLGVSTSVAVMLHEIPQEVSDFALLLSVGLSPLQAVVLNILSACSSIIAAIVACAIGDESKEASDWFLCVTVGSFIYLATCIIIPEMLAKVHAFSPLQIVAHTVGLFLGGMVMWIIAITEEHDECAH